MTDTEQQIDELERRCSHLSAQMLNVTKQNKEQAEQIKRLLSKCSFLYSRIGVNEQEIGKLQSNKSD